MLNSVLAAWLAGPPGFAASPAFSDLSDRSTRQRRDFALVGSVDPCRILLAEDDTLIRQLLTDALERSGYCVVAAPDGEEALALLAEANPDVLLTDMVMPKVDGLALLRAVRGTPGYEKLPVLVYTALDRVDVGLENVVVLQKGGRLAPVLDGIARLCEEAS